MKQVGFTLIELLVVIAIIAILAAILFPVGARAKDSAYRSSDMSHLNELRSALQLYRVDQGAYPPELFGYVSLYTSGANAGQVIPANLTQDYLYPKRVASMDTFKPAYDRAAFTDVVGGVNCGTAGNPPCAVWPNQDPAALGGDPQDGLPDTDPCARQAYGPTTTATVNPNDPTSTPLQFYKADGLDVALAKNTDGSDRYEIHYSLFWSGYGLGSSGCTPTPGLTGSVNDDPRQLGYNNPPDGTVVTWNSYFRDYDQTFKPPQGEKRDIVLFLGGSARMFDSVVTSNNSWRLKE